VDDTVVLQSQEKQLEILKKLKHESGSLQKWLLKLKISEKCVMHWDAR
jgi:hypothetical protein